MIASFHYITQDVEGLSHAELASLACRGGVQWVQLRLKNKTEKECRAIALETQKICRTYGAKLILNDDVLLAAEIGAEGVHLGKSDMPVEEARKILGSKAIIGATANTAEDIRQIHHTSANYIGVGPFRFTKTKENLSPVLGLEGLTALAHQSGTKGLPLIAIGGIGIEDVPAMLHTGVYGIAVSSAINLSADPLIAAKAFVNLLKGSEIRL
jgi:thiamine-phosphate pyrophosphorylase